MSSATARVAPDLLKARAVLSNRHNCQKISSWSRRPKTILEIRKKVTFLLVINNPIIYKFLKDFTNHRKKTSRAIVLSSKPFPNILKYRVHQWDLPAIWKERLFQTHISQLVCMKVQPQSSLHGHCNTIGTRCLWWIKVSCDQFNHLRSYWKIM